ncbi:uncharacterized protein LOC123313311 isoform X2 [Coccinella septempunctata]|uniref:uncharacterized protein LOC123313311 isoform X2 n=1 Tax=Coccinella septempunctata TaxID=41139 RepID=UPI001D06DA80|nr:uncharacterized protein LOC123313311 isoform X2 [Coccinella septempunctata]
MDLNPLIPNATASHDVAHILSESFESTIKSCIVPNDISENLRKNNVDPDYSLFQQYSYEVKQFADAANEDHAALQSVELDIMKKQGGDMILEKNIEEDVRLKEEFLLKRDGFFTSYPFNTKNLNLIDKCDILPHTVEQSLEFVYKKDLHGCKYNHTEKTTRNKFEEQPRNFSRLEFNACPIKITQKEEDVDEPIRLEPNEILFEDFELHTLYKKKVRLQNRSQRKRPFFFQHPKGTPFSIKTLSNAQFLAPGMYIDFQVAYRTDIYHNYSTEIEFSTSGGYRTVLKVTSFRRPPHLRVYIFRPMKHILHDNCPGTSEFWDRRCTALNDTIDCGHCFIGNYNYLSLLVGNVGNRGQFFLLTEDEWISGSHVDETMQFTKDCFKIFPSYIMVERDEVAEICVTFTPINPGLHVEKLYLVSDNNTSKAVEIIGDGLYFSKSMVQIHLKSRQFENVAKIGEMEDLDEELPEKRCFYLGHIQNFSSNALTFTVNNRSAMKLSFHWFFRQNENDHNLMYLELDWINMKNAKQNFLAPYTTHEFDVNIRPQADRPGHYGIIMGLCIEKIPENSLTEGEEFIVRKEEEFDGIKFLDIQLTEMDIACEIYDEPVAEKPERPQSKICDCPQPADHTESKIRFSTPMMDLGVIPIGLELEKKISIQKTTTDYVNWVIREIIYDIDARPSMYVARSSSIDESEGTLRDRERRLKYRVDAKKPVRWVSMLLLFTSKPEKDLKLNSMCMVTYEVVEWDIRIYSDVSRFPIVCSLKLHYVGIEYKWHFFIRNFTPILGCFWLLPPVGEGAHKMELSFHPKFGVIRPGEKIKVVVRVVPKETGLIDNIFVPCFVSRHRPPIMIRILGAIDDVNVYFYIPSQAEGFDKILWPPKVLNEVDFQQMKSTERLWSAEECDYVYDCKNDEKLENTDPDFNPGFPSDCSDLMQSCKNADFTTFTHDSSNSYIVSLTEFLKDRCKGDFLKQDYVVEVRDMRLKKPQKFSFYIENVTPIDADFLIETTNFLPCIDTETNMVNAITMIYPETVYSLWDKACAQHGIVVILDVEKGTLCCGDVIQINVWIYATTWGIYTEEIVVNINNIAPFCFNVFVEVNGSPVEFPIAKNTIRSYATLRFGHIPYMTDVVSRTLHMKNTSCIPLNIQWFLFEASEEVDDARHFNVILDMLDKSFRTSEEKMRLFLSKKNYGKQDISFMQVFPSFIDLEPEETSSVEITMNPKHFPVDLKDTNMSCYLIGYVFVKEEHKNRPNLYYRRSAEDLKPLSVELLATVAMPLLKLDMICGNSKCHLYATDVVEGKNDAKKLKMSFQNSNLTTVFVTFHVETPFSIIHISMRDYDFVNGVNNAVVKPGDTLEVELECSIASSFIEEMANWVYNKIPPEREKVCLETKAVTLCRHLNIHQRGVLEQSVPILCDIYYPKIEVSPPFLKFDHVKIGNTKKLYLHLFNATKVDIAFDIEQSMNLPQFDVKPKSGIIPKAVGLSRSFFDICVYFTPTLYNFDQESITIRTIIPQCYLEVPMNGYGIQNEKFAVNHFEFQP